MNINVMKKSLSSIVSVAILCLFANVSIAAMGNNDKFGSLQSTPDNSLKEEKHFNFDFQNIKTRSLLQIIAKAAGKNFVISESITGSMTLHLKRVTWRQALDVVLKANGLGTRDYHNVYLIAPIGELADNEIRELQAKKRVSLLLPLQSSVMRLKYASAKDIAGLLKGSTNSLLSTRGQVGVDSRTNSLWIQDTRKNIMNIRYYVSLLDIPARQVLIEAKIVSINKNDALDIGARFGISGTHVSGTFAGANALAGGTALSAIMPPTDRLNFNLPAIPMGATPGSVAVALLRIGSKAFLDMELSALERERRAKTISSPRLITSNQQPAYIERGEEIPYLTASSSGATSVEFKKAVLSLQITPQITPDDNIILKLKVTQNTRGEQIKTTTASFSSVLPPAINTKELQSQVFLHDGQTVVVGGIYERRKRNEVTRIPLLSALPVIGHLFKNRVKQGEQVELLIFITPRIIKPYQKPRHRYVSHKGAPTYYK